MTARAPTALHRDERGAAMVEFALCAPVLLLLMVGILDMSYNFYCKSVLNGAVENAARAATLESNNLDYSAIDDAVREQVANVNKNAELTLTRRSFRSFSRVNKAELFTDGNNNGSRDVGECFQDENRNGNYDTTGGSDGNGGAEDVVVYTATMEYDSILPLYKMIGVPQTRTLVKTTTLRNQPFDSQGDAQVICT